MAIDTSATRRSSDTPSGRDITKVALTSSAGAAVEWYDFFIYGTAAALVFPKLFFPPDLPLFVAQIAAFGTFAIGFIARPLGGILFGHFGDLLGRKRALVFALMLMGLSTALIGVLPTYHHVGIAAPLMLIVLRLLQGLAIGGQWGGAALLAIESAPRDKQGYYGSFVQVGVPLGVILANVVFLLVAYLLPTAEFAIWGWRIPFLLSMILVFIGIFVHFRIEESAGHVAASPQRRRSPVLEVALRHPKQLLLAGGAFIANNVCFYIIITYSVAYGTSTLGLSRELMLGSVVGASALMIPILVLSGWISDRWGRRLPFMLGAALSGAWAFAFFPLLETASPAAVFFAILIDLAFLSLMYGPQAALFAELFPPEVRYSGASIGYQLGAVVGGGFAPIIATALFAHYGSTFPIALYLAGVCAISFVCVAFLSAHRDEGPTVSAG
ncbi:MFS transporter [Sphingomonas sp.]|uniref:MFS transporter n=1 Tax=Sphingomonas sp. TaxID=28214 RepID=UPI002C22848C|nr:MFS transporter [Sphingomonas sp.]HWK36594.1 MFS transporter [Sphingomonas sp.]